MITIFNRKEIFVTYSMGKQIEVCDRLRAAKIPYTVGTSGNRMREAAHRSGGVIGGNINAMVEYKIYVKKEDYEKAVNALR